jgi:phosphonate transport system substrate-binding protein
LGLLVFVAALAFSGTLLAADLDAGTAKEFARKNNCLRCHAEGRKKEGPSYESVADKYRGKADAVAKLISHVTSGKRVKLSDGHEENHKTAKGSDAEIRNLVAWILAAGAEADAQAEPNRQPIRFGITGVILHEQYRLMREWSAYLAARLGRPVEFVSRDRYADITELLTKRKIEFAWISDYPYVLVRKQVLLLAVPIYKGKPSYSAYLIVPASDKRTTSLLQLKGTVFAYADPSSHSGYLVPRHDLTLAGENPNTFFRKTFFAWSHANLVKTVAMGLADGASVDAYIWDSLQKIEPELAAQTRIVSRSGEFAFPPIVASRGVSAEDSRALQKILMGMAADPAGLQLLRQFNLDGFTLGEPQMYDPVEKMMHTAGD